MCVFLVFPEIVPCHQQAHAYDESLTAVAMSPTAVPSGTNPRGLVGFSGMSSTGGPAMAA